jgi:hypothetical protein
MKTFAKRSAFLLLAGGSYLLIRGGAFHPLQIENSTLSGTFLFTEASEESGFQSIVTSLSQLLENRKFHPFLAMQDDQGGEGHTSAGLFFPEPGTLPTLPGALKEQYSFLQLESAPVLKLTWPGSGILAQQLAFLRGSRNLKRAIAEKKTFIANAEELPLLVVSAGEGKIDLYQLMDNLKPPASFVFIRSSKYLREHPSN